MMVQPKRRPPDLDHCIQVLSRLQNLHLNQSPKFMGEIYVCGVGMLYHLKLDRKTIKEIRTRHEGKASIPYPKANAIPAISAVVHNQDLFRALITCLSTTPAEMEAADSVRAQNMANASRKRTASIDGVTGDGPPPSKIMKLSHSPHASKRSTVAYGRPQMNVKLLAATILFVSFEHLDHWPAAFVRAYSEDCFGSRSWVDEAACRLFVENLALVHAIGEAGNCDTNMLGNAFIVSEFYKVSTESVAKTHVNGASTLPSNKRESLLSDAFKGSAAFQRTRSMSTDSVDIAPAASAPTTMMQSKTGDYGEESDSGDEEEVMALTMSAPPSFSKVDGDSSSSGEDGEEMAMSAKACSEDENGLDAQASKTTEEPPKLKQSYPIEHRELQFTRVRHRYFGANLEAAQHAIAASLQQRLDIKSKQNSGLLQTLPLFAGVPDVRRLITANLEKWLQSPALAGLARSLFAHTVSLFKNTDPPLPEDLDAIDNVLSMKLKPNQLNAHVENIKSIAKNISTATVAHHIYNRLLQQALVSLCAVDSSPSAYLKMIHGVHGVFPGYMSAAGIASAVMSFLYQRPGAFQGPSQEAYLDRICRLLRAITHDLGSAFNGLELLRCIAEFRVPDSVEWLRQNESDRARLLFQCVLLCVDNVADLQKKILGRDISPENQSSEQLCFEQTLSNARKIVLKWFCDDFARFYKPTTDDTKSQNGIAGAGVADYSSILDGETTKVFPDWENTIRALLFLEPPDSPCMQQFLSLSTSGEKWFEDDVSARASLCFEFGANVDDEMIQIVIDAAVRGEKKTPATIALRVLEHLFDGCRQDRRATMSLKDPTLLWELYRLVEYVPRDYVRPETSIESGVAAMNDTAVIPTPGNSKSGGLPRLAYPGLWWRATGLALIMCAASPGTIGRIAWNEHPTLQSLIKMVTSDRYRFPTVDCDEAGREEMKKNEQSKRDEEAKITEFLFLPPRKSSPKGDSQTTELTFGGSRVSRRQQEKRQGQLKLQREKEAREAQDEANRRRKMLRAAQKSIMLWDPKNGPRKPPKESRILIFSVGENFDLQRKFQRSIEPDFLLKTIGNTTRGAIERAYDWLIPIISFVPETIVRLPASASCFLLLRAYGTEGEERAQLQELSTPLLSHVQESLTGSFGEADAIRASDLLLTDLASHNVDRRRCARRVLHDAIGNDVDGDLPVPFRKSNCGWMLNLLKLKHTNSILPGAIRFFSQAASFERGRVLRFLVLALDKLSEVATEKKLMEGFSFATALIHLISRRPTVFASTMGLFPDLRSLAIRLVDGEFRRHISDTSGTDMLMTGATDEENTFCDIVLCCGPTVDWTSGPLHAKLPVALLKCSCLLLSIWREEDDGNAIDSLVRMLMRIDEGVGDVDYSGGEKRIGLASATSSLTGKAVIPVESWVMLARSRSDFIAKRAALTAPATFLPRLLLCSGLPQTSLLSMIDRLGKLGDKGESLDKIYNGLMVPSAASEWDIGRVGKKKEVARKLLGRLSAYTRMYKLSELKGDGRVSLTFLTWLSGSNQEPDKPRKQKTKEGKPSRPKLDVSADILVAVTAEPIENVEECENQLEGTASAMTDFLANLDCSARYSFSGVEVQEVTAFFNEAIADEQGQALEVWLQENFAEPLVPSKPVTGALAHAPNGLEMACLLLKSFIDLERKTESFGATVVKWVPVLTVAAGSPELWTFLLTAGQKPIFLWGNLISRCAQTWSSDHITACRDWILSQQDFEHLDLEKLVRFFVQSIPWSNIHIETFMDMSLSREDKGWGFTEDSVRRVLDFSILALISDSEDEEKLKLSRSRNNPPEALILLLLLSRFGRKYVQLVSWTLVAGLNRDDDNAKKVLLACILRVYACFPDEMNLGVAVLRSALKEAVEKFPEDWLSWRSPMDDVLEDLMSSLAQGGVPGRVVQTLVDHAKKHPLLILRKLGRMEELLEFDATARSISLESENRGVIFGRSLAVPAVAKIDANTLKVTMCHWGYNFTEIVWISFLDVVTSVHNEVLFGCGLKMGLDNFLGAYLRLMSVQSQLRTSDRLSLLKGKLSDFFAAFKSSNRGGWDEWMLREVNGLKSLGSARNVLLSCDMISHQEAIESVKASLEEK